MGAKAAPETDWRTCWGRCGRTLPPSAYGSNGHGGSRRRCRECVAAERRSERARKSRPGVKAAPPRAQR